LAGSSKVQNIPSARLTAKNISKMVKVTLPFTGCERGLEGSALPVLFVPVMVMAGWMANLFECVAFGCIRELLGRSASG
jgi:hypothetical protein